jgi:acyl-CoA synthetase (AMP-forming)/AMP-acid ligase II
MSITYALKRNVQQRGEATATLFNDRQRSWAELADRVRRFAGGLQSLDVGPGDRVAILALNSDRYYEYYLAVPWAGAVVVPLNIRWSTEELAYALNDSGAGTLLLDDAFLKLVPELRMKVGGLRAIVHMGDQAAPSGLIAYEALVTESTAIADGCRGIEGLAGIFYTGGTTGFSKGVMLSHRGLWSSAMSYLATNQSAADHVQLHAAPMFHLADGSATIMATLVGIANAMVPSFTVEGVLSAIRRYRVTDVVLVPTMINALVSHPGIADWDVSSLRCIAYGGSVIPEAVLRRAIAALPNCRFVQAYGQTELSPIATILGPERHVLDGPNAGKLTSGGCAALCNEIEIVDADGVEVPRGTIGEIRARGPNAMLGYWNKPEESARTLRAGWVYTGDAGYMDEDGFVFIVDRMKDMIVTGGENVYSAEVENAVFSHPAVAQCAVIAIPSEEWGEAVHAIVILKEGQAAKPEEIIAECKKTIAGYKCPRSVELRSEPFPLSGAGKILKRELRKPYWRGRTRQVN